MDVNIEILKENTVIVIFAINSNLPKDKELQLIRDHFKPNGVKLIQGCYNDLIENSYLVKTDDQELVEKLVRFADDWNQESILVIDRDTMDCSIISLQTRDVLAEGVFTKENPGKALDSGNWSRSGDTFWVIKDKN